MELRVLNESHEEILTTRANLALALYYLGRLDEAIDIEEQSLKVYSTFKEETSKTLQSRCNLAYYYGAVERYEESIQTYLVAIPACRDTLGPEHDMTYVAIEDCVAFMIKDKRFEQALPHARELVSIAEKKFKPDSKRLDAARAQLTKILAAVTTD